MKNLGVSRDLCGTREKILFHTGVLKGQGVPLHRNQAGHLTLNVKDICEKGRASAHGGWRLNAASSFPLERERSGASPPAQHAVNLYLYLQKEVKKRFPIVSSTLTVWFHHHWRSFTNDWRRGQNFSSYASSAII